MVRLPYYNRNIPKHMFLSKFSAEMLRLCRINTEFNFFMDSLCSLKDRILTQGANLEDLRGTIIKSYRKYFIDFIKFNTNLNNILRLLNL